METLDTEKEQLQQLKRWLQENGLSLVLGIALGLGGVYGWRAWKDYQVEVSAGLSNELHTVVTSLSKTEYQETVNQAQSLLKQQETGLYADMARLVMARAQVEQGQLEAAVKTLDALVTSGDKLLVPVARYRLARLYVSLQRYDEAEKLLDAEKPASFAGLYEELKGDVYLAKGDSNLARASYEKARSLALPEADIRYLTIKLENLQTSDSVQASGDKATKG